mmetsp:Transcript_30614/g.72924  ORF Transcript_30614/g.72924 Transcript_30614/m.72924 type:complete len:253 (-) Transcript_30614:8-766(-)
MSEVILVLSLVARAIRPGHRALPAHVALLPGPDVDTPVREVIGALTVHSIVVKLPLIDDVAIGGLVHAVAVLASLEEVAIILGAVCPALNAASGLLVLEPLANIGGAIFVRIFPLALGTVLEPFTFINVSVCRDKLSKTMSSATLKTALIGGAIGPSQCAMPVALVALPLALVLCTSLHLRLWLLDQVFVRRQLPSVGAVGNGVCGTICIILILLRHTAAEPIPKRGSGGLGRGNGHGGGIQGPRLTTFLHG